MDRLAYLEESAKKIIEEKLLGLFQGRISAVRLAREILKELIERKERGISQVYAPNYFRVFLNPGDYSPITQLGREFIYELERFLKAEAGARKLNLMGPLKVELEQEEELGQGIVVVEWDFLPDVSRREMEEKEPVSAPPGNGMDFMDTEPAFLIAVEGYGQGNVYRLEKKENLIGQDESCNIILKSPMVAPRHIRIRRMGRDYVAEDLGSPSGLYVNLRKVREKKLQEGDMIAVGSSVLKFHLS